MRMAIIGVGWAGSRQVEAIRELGEKVSVACLVDNDEDFLQQKAEEFGIGKTYSDMNDALQDPEIDAVSICLPHTLHREATDAAAQAGKHILCEKPIALTVDDATAMIAAAEEAGVVLYVAENVAYASMTRYLAGIVRSGEYIGEMISASYQGGFRARPVFGYPGRREWLTRPEQGGTGTWMLHGVHSMAQLRYILGEVESIYLHEHHADSFQRVDIEGTVKGLLILESGVPVDILQTCEIRLENDLKGYEVHGDQGVLRASKRGCQIYSTRLQEEPLFLEYPEQGLSEYAREVEAFVDLVNGDEAGPTTARSERRSLAVVQAGYESIESGAPINIRERFGNI